MGKPRFNKMMLAVFVTFIFLLTSASMMAMNAEAAEEHTFVMGMGTGVQSANPFIGIYDSDYLFYSYVYDLLMYPDQDGNPTPNLAKSWWHMDGNYAFASGSSSADLLNRPASSWPQGSIWEYNLTPGVTWNDGAPFDADDVVFTVALQTGVNYPNFWAYQPYTKWIDHCQKLSTYKVRLFFTDRTDPSNVAKPISWGSCLSFPIMPKHILQDLQPVNIAQDWKGIPAIGTGPFMGTDILQDEIIAKEKVTLIKNPEWERGIGTIYNRTCDIDKLIMKFYSEEQVLVLDLKTKKIDATELTPINYLSLNRATDNPQELRLVSEYSPTVYTKISHFNFLIGGTAPGNLNPARVDPAVHRATAIATDRDDLVADVFDGLGTKGVGILTPVYPKWYYNAYADTKNISWFNVTSGTGSMLYSYHDTIANVMGFNITKANEILNASGYTWPTYPTGYRMIGDVAANRLVAMGVVASVSSAKMDSKGNPRYLEFDDIYEQAVFEDHDISDYLAAQWAMIGVKMIPTPVNTATWNKVVYGFQECFTESYWSGDPDPNYLLYVPSTYSMDGWNEWGSPINDPDWWDAGSHGGKHYYDYCYDMQAQSMDETQRIHWVQECEKYLFLSGSRFLTTCNPKNCYGYIDGRWTNWGDWEVHPGLQIDHFWGETPVLMKVRWSASLPKCQITSPTINSEHKSNSEVISLSGRASEGVLGVTWVNEATHMSGTADGTENWVIQSMDLEEGVNVITVTACDAKWNAGTDVITITYVPFFSEMGNVLLVVGAILAAAISIPLVLYFVVKMRRGKAEGGLGDQPQMDDPFSKASSQNKFPGEARGPIGSIQGSPPHPTQPAVMNGNMSGNILRFCPFCGKPQPPEFLFCSNCGKKIT